MSRDRADPQSNHIVLAREQDAAQVRGVAKVDLLDLTFGHFLDAVFQVEREFVASSVLMGMTGASGAFEVPLTMGSVESALMLVLRIGSKFLNRNFLRTGRGNNFILRFSYSGPRGGCPPPA